MAYELSPGEELLLSVLTPDRMAQTATAGTREFGDAWQPASHLVAISEVICEALLGRTDERIIVIETPPRHGKSEFVSKWLPAWYLCLHPTQRVLLASYEADFAADWGEKVRNIVSGFGSRLFGHRIDPNHCGKKSWRILGGEGGMATAGVGGPLTGRGANLLVVDDPVKNAEEALSPTVRQKHWDWWQSTASTRLEPDGVAIVMATRWHKEDLSGRLLTAADAGEGEPVLRLHLPAIAEAGDWLGRREGEALWPQRWSLERLLEIKSGRTPYWWQALYQQRPTQATQAEFPDDYFGEWIWCPEDDWPERFEHLVVAVDPSKGKDTGDYCALVALGYTRGRYFADAIVRRLPVHQICQAVVNLYRQYRPVRIGLEANAWQDLLEPEMQRASQDAGLPPLPISLITNKVNKQVRIGRIGPYLARKRIQFRRTSDAIRLVDQLREFPLGDHDDGPDGLEMAIRLLNHIATARPRESIRIDI